MRRRRRPNDHSGRMSRRAICSAARFKINLGDKRRHKRLDPRKAHEHAIERAGHASGSRTLPGISRQRRLDERRHRRRLNSFAGDIAQYHNGAIVGKTDKRIEVTTNQRRQVYRIGCDARNVA